MSKKIILLALFILPFISKGTNYTSTANGNWSSSSTWSPGGVPGSGDNVTIANTVTLDANESVNNITINSSKTLTVSGSNGLTVYGNFTNNGTFTYATGTVTFAGSANQSISGGGVIAFYNLTINPSSSTDTVSLGRTIVINLNLTISQGVLADNAYAIGGNTSGTFSMASGTTLVVGLPTSSSLPGLPSSYTNAHTSFDPASTVVFQANNTSTGQTISIVPYYGNVTVTTSNAGTAGGSLFYVRGNLTVTGVTFTMNASIDTVKGSVTIGSGATYSSSITNEYFQGNFTNNGTFTRTNGTVHFTGSSNQSLGGSGTSSFFDLTINSGATVTLGDAITVTGNFLLSAGTFDVSASNYGLTVGGGFTNNATFNAESGNVTMNSTLTPTLGGTTSTTFYTLTINSTSTITLGNAITVYNLAISSGTLATSTYQITGNASGTLTMAAGTFLDVGNNGSATVVSFPTNFVAANISLNTTSTVDYLTHSGSQVISVVPTYGNLIIAGVIAATKSLSGTPLSVAGNLTVSSTVTLGAATNTINLSGNLVTNGTLAFSSGALNIAGNLTNNGGFTAGTSTVTFNGSANQTISGASNITFYNFTANPAAVTDTIFQTIFQTTSNNFTISQGVYQYTHATFTGNATGTLSMAAGTGLVLGSPTVATNVPFPSLYTSITLDPTSTVTYQANLGQTVSAAPTYGNLVVSTGSTATTKTLAGNITVNGNLTINANTTLDCEADQITGNITGVMTMASGSSLILGATSSSTAITFPTLFTSLHITLNASSTVTYQANAAQTISVNPPAYGNLVLSKSGNKTPASSPLVIAGNLTINSGVTLPESTGTINLTGSLTNSGSLTFTSGALNIGGSLTNNGTFTYGTSTTTFNGSSGQSISGSTYPTFYNLTISGTGGETVGLGGNQTVTNTLSITSGTLDATIFNYNLTIGGNFTNSGGTFSPRSNTVTMNGSSQILGGSTLVNLNKLTISSGTTTLGGNITTTSDITINSSATLNAVSYTITTAGNFIDNGTFTAGTSTVYFDKNGHQCISGSSIPTFKNVTVGSLSTLAAPGTININGTVTVLPGGVMACSC